MLTGKCTCDYGLSVCNGNCVDLKTDDQNCNSCNHRCPSSLHCSDGQCVQ
jgi:hypothetical protein